MLHLPQRVFKSYTDRSLKVKGAVVMGIPLIALLVAIAFLFQLQRQTRVAEAWVEHTLHVSSGIQEILTLSLDAESGVRRYALSGKSSFLGSYWEAQRQLPNRIGALQALIADNPGQLSRLASVQTAVATTLASLDPLRPGVAGRAGAATGELESQSLNMDRLRQQLEAMDQVERRLLAMRTEQQQQAERHWTAGILTGGIAVLSGGLISALLFFTGIIRRVQRVEEDAVRAAEGIPLGPDAGGRDEIARLARVLREAAGRLSDQDRELRAAQHDLEERVKQRTSELLTANQRLHQVNELRQAVIQASPLAIWATDLESNVMFWNPAAERIFGWREEDVIGRPLMIVPEAQEEEYRNWHEGFRAGKSLAGAESVRLKKDGSKVDVAIWTAPLRDTDGKVIGTIAIDSDVTEQKRLEEQFRQSQKLEAVGQLAGGIAHDFNNLLTVIGGYVAMLLEQLQDEPELTEYASEIQLSVDRASALTMQLLAFSRRQISQPRVLDLNEVVSKSIKLLNRLIGEHIAVSTVLRAQFAKVRADPIHIEQMIMNLAVNARDSMPDGGRLTIETANVTLDDEYAGKHIDVKPGPYVLLAIGDTGIGMSAETRSHLFEPFFTTKPVGKGTGLGLSIVYGIVKQSGGEIMVYSEPGKGTTFKIYLPHAEAIPELPAAQGDSSRQTGGGETILVCEDEAVIRKLVHTMLGKLGYKVLEAATPSEAIDIAKQASAPIDLLLTDVVMPGANGFELSGMIRELRPDVPVLYMSGYTDSQIGNSWVLGPETPLLQKPFSIAALDQMIREVLDGKSAGAS